jgi:hypothetical protein
MSIFPKLRSFQQAITDGAEIYLKRVSCAMNVMAITAITKGTALCIFLHMIFEPTRQTGVMGKNVLKVESEKLNAVLNDSKHSHLIFV